jgi:hypothetical protein
MDMDGRAQQKETSLHRLTPLAIKEKIPPASHELNLISRVRLLCVMAHRRVKFNHQRSMRKHGNCQITGGWWSFGQCLGQAHMNGSWGDSDVSGWLTSEACHLLLGTRFPHGFGAFVIF